MIHELAPFSVIPNLDPSFLVGKSPREIILAFGYGGNFDLAHLRLFYRQISQLLHSQNSTYKDSLQTTLYQAIGAFEEVGVPSDVIAKNLNLTEITLAPSNPEATKVTPISVEISTKFQINSKLKTLDFDSNIMQNCIELLLSGKIEELNLFIHKINQSRRKKLLKNSFFRLIQNIYNSNPPDINKKPIHNVKQVDSYSFSPVSDPIFFE